MTLWVEDSGGPKEPCIRRGSDLPMARSNFQGKGAACCKVLRLTAVRCAKQLNQSRCHLGCGLGGPKEPRVRWGSRSPYAKAQFLGERTYPGMPDDTAVSCAKMVERIEMSFGFWTREDPRKYVLHGRAHWRYMANTIEPSMFGGPAKTTEPIEMLFVVWTLMGPRNHVLDGASDRFMPRGNF